ncbi:collagen alpha-1(I) chain-like [Meriones unguiculatus]|uniref:collagen alpha-1(I) chain-like n=1 Tax=Meriones unguiculatus TaxID=10047 RepID=UPI00293E3B8D|nr:collagen alpha-1(I) chain-like [Meriones unguiculatus]
MKDVNFPQARIFSFATVQTKNSLSHNPEDYSLHEGEPRNKFKKEEKSLNLGKRKRKRELRTALTRRRPQLPNKQKARSERGGRGLRGGRGPRGARPPVAAGPAPQPAPPRRRLFSLAGGGDGWGGVRPRAGRGAAPAPGHAAGEPRPQRLFAAAAPPHPTPARPPRWPPEADGRARSKPPTYHSFLRPFLRRAAGAGSREARPGACGVARARLGPRRGALGRGSVNIHEAPPLLRGPRDPAARRPPLCPGLPAAHTRARRPRARASAPGAEGAAARRRPPRRVGSRAAPRPAPAGPGLSAPREDVGRGGGRRTLPWPGRAGRGPPLPRSPSARLAGPAGARAASRGRTARAFLLDPPPLPPHLFPLPSRGTLGGEEFAVRGAKLEEAGRAGTRWCSPGSPKPGHPLALSPPHPDAEDASAAASRAALRERAQPSSCLVAAGTGLGGRWPPFCGGWGAELRDMGLPDKGVSPPAAPPGSFLRRAGTS